MTLVNRVSAFFLAALAICLAGYSLLGYVLIREHLYGQFDNRLRNAFRVLTAAIEVEPEGVKWQPSDHTIMLGDERDADDVRWVITDPRGHVVDRSRNLDAATVADARLLEWSARSAGDPHEIVDVAPWRLMQQTLAAPDPSSGDDRDADEFDALTLTVAGVPGELHANLFQLALLLVMLPAALWIVAAIVGRRYCQRALHPVRSMADQARAMQGADFQTRMDVAARRDELGELALAFNGLLDQLQQAFERQRRFTGNAAHQLRTPLTVLRGEIDLALRRPRSADEYRQTLETLSRQTENLQQIVETLLFLARAESDAAAPQKDELALAAWLPEHLARWRAHERGDDLTCSIDPRARVLASATLLGQAIDNLLENAMKYSPAGTPVQVHVITQGPEVAISVEDDGIGVPASERDLVFAPFYRSPAARQSGSEGIGLGLALVARVAEALGGRVACEAKGTRGARFVLYLPLSASVGHTTDYDLAQGQSLS
ncbi:MAG: HAMP domain-containing protein [Pirellulales bacterium]|nr:HAMP domain-containing protein [Pirellulales bacterium]